MQNENKFEEENKLESSNSFEEQKKQVIEIPQAYYDKLAQEKQEQERLLEEKEEQKRKEKEQDSHLVTLFGKSLFSTIIFYFSLYVALHKSLYCFAIIPVYILLGSFFFAFKDKKKSEFSLAILLGGIFLAILCFALSMLKEETADLWFYYTLASIVIAFFGFLTSSIITWFVVEYKNVKALQTIGFFLYFILLVGIPYGVYQKYPESFMKIVFRTQSEVKAETQQEFIEKTLKNRYGEVFTCDEGKNAYQYGNNKQMVNTRKCSNEKDVTLTVQTTAYDESRVLYIVKDNYMQLRYLSSFKENVENNLKNILNASVTVRLYPETKCEFVGDCVDCEEYILYHKDMNNKTLYEYSSKLSLEKYMSYTNSTDFVNDYQFKYVIHVVGQYGGIMSTKYADIIETILTSLNEAGLKNTYGYEITLKNSNELNRIVYQVKGSLNEEQTFKDPIVVE